MTPHADLVARLLRELVTLVRGECPALLNEDSGGDARLSLAIDDALGALPPPADPAEGSPFPLEHARTCGDAYDPDARCTCGLSWRVRLVTEQEHRAAWQKRAEEAELARQADPPALVALVREWQQDVENLGGAGPDEDITDQYQKQVWESEAKLLSYPLPPPVTSAREAEDTTWAGAVTYVRDMAATIRAMAQKFVSDPGMAELAKVRAEALDSCADGMERAWSGRRRRQEPAAPPVTDTPQGCPTCGGPRPCDRCTTSNAVDLDALKARLENERLRAAAEIVKLIADDSWAVTFQSLGQYRSALLKVWRDSAPAVQQED